MKDYRHLCLKCDVLLLAHVFKKFRNNCLKNRGLCPSHYSRALTLSWDAMPYMAKEKLELISYLDMLFEKGMRGGVSYICNRYSKTSKKFLRSYDPKQESKHIMKRLICEVMESLNFFPKLDSNG